MNADCLTCLPGEWETTGEVCHRWRVRLLLAVSSMIPEVRHRQISQRWVRRLFRQACSHGIHNSVAMVWSRNVTIER